LVLCIAQVDDGRRHCPRKDEYYRSARSRSRQHFSSQPSGSLPVNSKGGACKFKLQGDSRWGGAVGSGKAVNNYKWRCVLTTGGDVGPQEPAVVLCRANRPTLAADDSDGNRHSKNRTEVVNELYCSISTKCSAHVTRHLNCSFSQAILKWTKIFGIFSPIWAMKLKSHRHLGQKSSAHNPPSPEHLVEIVQ
jgi:hypothetical protein